MFENTIEFLFEKIIIPTILIAFMAFFFVGIPMLIYGCVREGKKPNFELKKDDWECKQATSWTSMVLVGKVMVPQQHTRCILWGEK